MPPRKAVPPRESTPGTRPAGPSSRHTSPTRLHHILEALKKTPDAYVSGAALASGLRVSRTSVWKHIQALRARGYPIDAHPKLGYRLTGSPERILPEELLPRLRTEKFGRVYHHLEATTSTNDEAMALALQGSPHGTLVVAEQQTRGRGRLQRPWTSAPHHGIYLSLLLRGHLPLDRAPQATMIAALSLARLLRSTWGLAASIKWPNDVLIQGKKVAGILTEAKSDQDQVHFLIVGVGINVNHGEADLKGPFRYPATSLAMEIGHTLRRVELLASYLDCFEKDYERWGKEGFEAFSEEWEAASWIMRKNVTLQCSGGRISGKVLGFSSEGALRLLQMDGMVRVVWAGDVERVEGMS